MNFFNALAGSVQGGQDFQKFQMQQQQARLLNQQRQMQVDEFQQQQARNQDIARGTNALFGQGPIPPAPGQASQPMQQNQPMPQESPMQAPQQPMQSAQGPQGLDVSKIDPRMMQMLMRKDPKAFQRGVTDFQQTSQAPQIPPYQSLNAQPQQPQGQSIQIGEPPKYDWDTALKKVQALGITDPQSILAIMEKQQTRLDTDAKQKLAFYKEQEMAQYRQMVIGERAATREQRAPLVAAQTTDYASRTEDRPQRTQVLAKNADTRAGGASGAGGMNPDVIEYMAGQLAGGNTGVLTGFGRGAQGAKDLQAVRSKAVDLLRNQGVSPEEANAKVAQFGGEKAGARTAGTRGANLSIAATELGKFSDIALDASAKVARTQFVPFNKAAQSVQMGTGSEDVVAFVAANESVINAFAQVAGRGTPTVAGMEHARVMLNTAQTPQQYQAVIKQLKLEAKAATESVTEVQTQQRERMGGKSDGPKAGVVRDGYRFKGGDPAKQDNWEKQ